MEKTNKIEIQEIVKIKIDPRTEFKKASKIIMAI